MDDARCQLTADQATTSEKAATLLILSKARRFVSYYYSRMLINTFCARALV